MSEPVSCAICGDVIDVGQAWMEADEDEGRRFAHAGCVYRDEPGALPRARWRPGKGRPRPIDERSYGASAAESGGLYNDEEGPTAVNITGDTMGTNDDALRDDARDLSGRD